jgi:hypothetical protein
MNGLSGDDFENSSRDAKPGVVVAPHLAWSRELRQVAEPAGEVGVGLGAAIVNRELPLPSRRVGQQMRDGHRA